MRRRLRGKGIGVSAAVSAAAGFALAAALVLAAFAAALTPAAAFADLLPLPTTTITATKVLTSWPEDTGEEFYIGTAECTGVHSIGDTYVAGYWSNEAGAWLAGDGSEAQPNTDEPTGNIRFDWVFTDETGFFGPEGQVYTFESLTQCIDRRGAGTPGCWGESWPHEPDFQEGVYTHAEWYATFEGVANGICTYTITTYITDGVHTWQWIGYQRTQGTIKVQFSTTSSLTLVKQSAKPQVTDGNSLYSLEGIQYGLYASAADAQSDANRLHTYTMAADGTTDAAELTVSGATTYYVKELTPVGGVGYKQDPQVRSVAVQPLEDVSFTVADEPVMDPFAVRKTITAAGAAGETEPDLAGQVRWTVEFYPGARYDSVAAAKASGTPARTWVITCDSSGYAEVSEAYLVDGSAPLFDDGGVAGIPLGTVVCTETWVDPDGPAKLTDTSPRLIWMTATGPDWRVGSSTWTDDAKSGYVEVEKTLLDGSGNAVDPAPLEGIQVQVVSAATGSVVETLTLDADGYAKSGKLVWGTYNLVEVAASVPANIYTWCERNGKDEGEPFATVKVGAVDGATMRATFENELKYGTAWLWKRSTDEQLAASSSIYADRSGAQYALYGSAEDAAADANRVLTWTTDAEGRTETSPEMELGTYWVREVKAPDSGAWALNDSIVEVELAAGENSFAMEEAPIGGTFAIVKRDLKTGDMPQGRATFANTQVHVAYYPVFATSEAELDGLEPERTWDLETDDSGNAQVGEALPAGTYAVSETAAPWGYLLTDTDVHLAVIDAEGVHGAEEGAIILRDEAAKAQIRVEKTLLHAGGAPASAAALEGIRITVTDADTGLAVDTVVLGADGAGTSVPLPVGTYELVEVGESVPQGVQPYSWTVAGTADDIVFARVEITPDDHGTAITRTLADYVSETPSVHKTDIDSGEGLGGAVITLYKAPDAFITVADGVVTVDEAFTRTDLSAWEKVADFTTDSQGYVGLSMAKFGLWAWVETSAPVPYLTEARTQDIHAAAPIIHEMLFDKDHESQAQSCADRRVSIAVYIKEQTIEVTSAALDAETAANFRDANNVGTETQWYLISAQNASSVDTDNFAITMDFDDIRAHGGRVVTVTTPVTAGDEDGEAVLWYATADAPGTWVEWARVSATEAARFSVDDLGGVELGGIKLDYGWVAKDFTVGPGYNPENGEDLAFEIVYTEALSPDDDVVIVHGVDVYTDLAVTDETTIWATDDDGVRTVVIEPAPKRASSRPGGIPHTADDADVALAGGICAAASAVLAVSAAALRRSKKGGRR